MNVVKEIQRVNAREASAQRGEFRESASWHSQYKDSAYVFIGGCPFELTEGDLICIFSQFGEVVDVNLVRDKDTGKSKGFAFLAYEDQRSTVLAVDNLNGSKVMNRTLRVDHCAKYKRPKKDGEEEDEEDNNKPIYNALPEPVEPESGEDSWDDNDYGLDPEDPMYKHLLKKAKKERRKIKQKERKEAKKEKKRTAKEQQGSNSAEDLKDTSGARARTKTDKPDVEHIFDKTESSDRRTRTRINEPEPESKISRRSPTVRDRFADTKTGRRSRSPIGRRTDASHSIDISERQRMRSPATRGRRRIDSRSRSRSPLPFNGRRPISRSPSPRRRSGRRSSISPPRRRPRSRSRSRERPAVSQKRTRTISRSRSRETPYRRRRSPRQR